MKASADCMSLLNTGSAFTSAIFVFACMCHRGECKPVTDSSVTAEKLFG